MLLDLREFVRNSKPVKYTLITVICIPFVLFGVGSYFTGGGYDYAAVIDGEEIGVREYEQAYNQQRQRLQQMFGGQIPEGFANDTSLREQAIESLVTQQALRNAVSEAKFTVSDTSLAQAIQAVPGFQRDGAFDTDRYRAQLISSSMSVDQFEASFRDDTALAQFRSGIVETAFQLPAEKARLDDLNRQVRKVDSVVLPIAERMENIEVSDEDIQTHFDEKAADFNFPQRVKIEYLSLNITDLASAIEISDTLAQTHYDDNKQNYLVLEERKASHILLKPEEGDDEAIAAATQQLLDIKARVEGGEEFAAIATEVSKDLGSAKLGGSLGQFGRGQMVPPFEEALFAMTEPGALSDPVESEFGVHLILLEQIVEEHGAKFDEVKSDIITQLQTEQADTEYLDLMETLTEQSYDNPESLEAAADATGLEVKTSDWIDGTENSDPNPALSNPQILGAALSEDVLQENNNSDVLQMGEKQNLVLRVLEHEDPRPKTIDDVREDIEGTLKRERAGEQMDESIASLKELIDAGEDPAALVEEQGGTFSAGQELTRNSTELDRSVISELFALNRPTGDKPVLNDTTLGNGDRILIALREVITPEADVESSEEDPGAAPAAASKADQVGNTEFTVLLENLRKRAKVEINDQLLTQ